MLSVKQTSLKPQDIVVCLKVLLSDGVKTIKYLAETLSISSGEIHGALKRAEESKLIIVENRVPRVNSTSFVEFVIHGLKYSFPASGVGIVLGMRTGIAAFKEFDRNFSPTEALPLVWPYSEGRDYGLAIAPLFPSVPKAAAIDERLYMALALIDAMRVGAARERAFAVEELKMMLAR